MGDPQVTLVVSVLSHGYRMIWGYSHDKTDTSSMSTYICTIYPMIYPHITNIISPLSNPHSMKEKTHFFPTSAGRYRSKPGRRPQRRFASGQARAAVSWGFHQQKTGLKQQNSWGDWLGYTLWKTYKKILNMAIEIVDLPMKNSDIQ